MFEDSGRKLKAWACVLFVLTVIGLIIYGIVQISSINKIGYQQGKLTLITLGTIAIAIFGAWLSAAGIYTLGDIHEKTDQLLAKQKEIETLLRSKSGGNADAAQGEKKAAADSVVYPQKNQELEKPKLPDAPVVRNKVCPKCKADNPADYLYCQYCGEKLN